MKEPCFAKHFYGNGSKAKKSPKLRSLGHDVCRILT